MSDRNKTFQSSASSMKRASKRVITRLIQPLLGGISTRSTSSDSFSHANDTLWPFDYEPKKVLLVRFDVLGDTVMSLALAADLKGLFPDISVSFATTPESATIARLCPYIDEIIEADAPAITHIQTGWRPDKWLALGEVMTKIRNQNFDIAISLYGPLSGTITGFSGAKWRIGYGSEASTGHFDVALAGKRSEGIKHEIEWVRGLSMTDNIELATNLVEIPQNEHLWAESIISECSTEIIALHPGARTGDAKRWPTKFWRQLAKRLDRAHFHLITVGGPAELQIGENILRGLSEQHSQLAGSTSIPQLAAILDRVDLFVSGDSGPLHLASSLGTPVVGIYGPTDPTLSGPYGVQSEIVRANIPCSPCYNLQEPASCAYGDQLCMQWIEPHLVMEAVHSTMRQRVQE